MLVLHSIMEVGAGEREDLSAKLMRALNREILGSWPSDFLIENSYACLLGARWLEWCSQRRQLYWC